MKNLLLNFTQGLLMVWLYSSALTVKLLYMTPGKDIEHSIIAIENGHVTGRRIGDGPSQIVLESLHNSEQNLKQEDKLAYLTKTKTGKF